MYQKITIIGNLGNDPEMRYTPSGQAVCNYSVATNKSYTNQDGVKVTITTWFRVSTWGKRAEIDNQYLKKGNKVFVEGELNPDKDTGGPKLWQRQDGSMAASYEITGRNIVFLTSRGEAGEEYPAPADSFSAPTQNTEPVPF